jgi:hypothetical protein
VLCVAKWGLLASWFEFPQHRAAAGALGDREIAVPATIICSHLGYDNVSHCHPPAPRCAIDPFGAGRVVSTDFPYEHADTCVRAIDYDADAAGDADLQRAFSRLTRWHYLVSAHPAVRLCFTASMVSVQRGEGIRQG